MPCTATPEELEKAYTGACDICGRIKEKEKRRMSLHHCHKTGRFINWLCASCHGIEEFRSNTMISGSKLVKIRDRVIVKLGGIN